MLLLYERGLFAPSYQHYNIFYILRPMTLFTFITVCIYLGIRNLWNNNKK